MPNLAAHAPQEDMGWAAMGAAGKLGGVLRGAKSGAQEEDVSAQEKQFKTERRGGNYGMGTKEMQAANYRARKAAEARRRELFDQALSKFKKNDIEGVRPRCAPQPASVTATCCAVMVLF
jgi:hypothetical protein